MIRCVLLAVSGAFAVFMLSLLPADADGCAPVRRSDRQDPPIVIAEESAIIVWDSIKKVEHFIRRAAFDTPSPDFGFLVPTPGPDLPELKAMEDYLFKDMDKWILPKIVDKANFRFDPIMTCGCDKGARKERTPSDDMEAKSGVRVLAEQKVGGHDTAILEADNTEALSKWLTDNKYSNDPELQSWLAPYVAAKWRITAFKISQDPKTGLLATTKPVRMSFKAERPFFPYREPEQKPQTEAEKKAAQEKRDKANGGKGLREFHFDERGERIWNDARLLRVHFVSNTRMDGMLGNAVWHAKVPFTDQLTDEQRKQIAKDTGIAENDLPAQAWLTTFEDRADPRPGKEEVYFDPAKDQTPIRPPDFIRTYDVHIPIDCSLVGVALIAYVGFRIVRSRRKQAA